MASNPSPGQAGGIPKLTSSDFKPVDCNVEYAATKWIRGVSTYKVLASGQAILTRYQRNQSSQDTNTLGTTEGRGYCKKRQRAVLTTKETRYNFRLLERDKRARRNQLQLLTNKPIQDSPLSQEATHG